MGTEIYIYVLSAAVLITMQAYAAAGLSCYDATSYDGNLPPNATLVTNCTSCATSRMRHILYTFITYQWSCQRSPPNAPPIPDSSCATMWMETSDKANTYTQAMCQCCDDGCNKNPCRAWNPPLPEKQTACNCANYRRHNASSRLHQNLAIIAVLFAIKILSSFALFVL